jgi:CRP-like cAMP-binding protein
MDATIQERDTAFREIVQRLVAWGLPPEEVEYALQGAVEVIELAPRAQLFAQATPLTAVYLLQEGRIYQERISQDGQGRRVSLRREAHPGEWIGHYDLLYSQQYSSRARALDQARLIAVQAAPLNRLLYRYPRLRQRIAPLEKIGRLRTIPLFGALDLTALSYLADVCQLELMPARTQLYSETDPADRIFIIDQGQVVLTGPDRDDLWLGNGMAFGMLDQPLHAENADGFAYGHRATTTVPTTLFTVSRQQLRDLAGLDPERTGLAQRQTALETLDKVTIFLQYNAQERRRLLGYMSHYHIPIPHLLMQQGEVGDSLWVLMPGGKATLHALEGGQALPPTVVHGPNFFSELALRVEHPLNSTVQAEPNSQWLRLHTDDFQTFLRDHGAQLLSALALSPAAERFLGRSQARRRYSWLQKGENLVIFRRRHWLALVHKCLLGIFLLIFASSAWLLISLGVWDAAWLNWLVAIATVVGALQAGWGILDYLNDYLLVTNQRVVRQEKVLFVTEWQHAAFLEQISNIDISTDFLGNMFHYGELRVQTAATGGTIAFDFVRDPLTLKRIILEQQSLRLQHYQASSKMVIQNLLEDRFGLRLRLPSRVRPEPPRPPASAPAGLRQWLRHALDIREHMHVRDQEKVIWRKHWFVLLAKITAPVLILLLILLMIVGQRYLPSNLQAFVGPFDLLLVLFGLAMVAWIAWNVADWRNDTYEIDNKQISDVEKKPLFFAENRRTALLGEIENIEVRIPSPLHFLLNFGNVRLQTAASHGEFSFDWVPDPRGVSEEIRRRIELYRQQQEAMRARQRAQELPDWFEMYNRIGADSSQ